MRLASLAVIPILTLSALAADRSFTPYADFAPLLDFFRAQLPAGLEDADETRWKAWAKREDQAIRARLEQGDLDSMVNMLLFGTSFTKQPRIQVEHLVEASRSGILRARLDDLLRGLRAPAGNERLIFLRNLIRAKGMDPDEDAAKTGVFIMENLQRVLHERIKFGQRKEGSGVYRDRGVSLDATILPNFGIEEGLRDLKSRGLLREGEVRRVAVIGPGLDFTDKESGYDYYPQQTLQPFAVEDSLLRLDLAKRGAITITVFDISPRVLEHLQHAREQAAQGVSYAVQLPRDSTRSWVPAAVRYWRSFGDQIAMPATPLHPPEPLKGLETRAVTIQPQAVLTCEPVDLNIVLQRLEERFDLVVATNVFVYYDSLQQTMALENVASMLNVGGFLLSNDELPELPRGRLHLLGRTLVRHIEEPPVGDSILWYQKK